MRLVAAALMSLFLMPAWAWESPRQAIVEFLAFDLNGGRLAFADWETYVSKYLAAPKNYDEPGWDEALIVDSYRIVRLTRVSENLHKAQVEFRLHPTKGLNPQNIVIHDNGGLELVTYTLERRNNEWLLVPNFGAPRILFSTYKKYRPK